MTSTADPVAHAAAVEATGDLRVTGFQPLVPPADLRAELPLGPQRAALVRESRRAVHDILAGADDRLLLIVGPCSVHDPEAALDYARRLAAAAAALGEDLLVVMRIYFEKPRTTWVGKGLINDPAMDETHDVHRGLRLARQLLLDILALGLPVGLRVPGPDQPQYIADTVTWGAIGARTAESQVHRQLASGLSMPVGFKNATDGDVQPAVDGCRAAAARTRLLRSRPTRPWRGRLHSRQPRLPRHPARRARRPQLRCRRRARRLGPAGRCRKTSIPDHRRQPRQQRQGPHRQSLVVRDVAGRLATGAAGSPG